MTNFSYTKDIPDGPNNPSVDQPKMKVNTNSTSDLIAVDHNSFNVANGGYHTDIHMVPQSTPGAILGIGQLYSQTIAGDQELFYESGGGVITQLTGANAPSPGQNGYVFLPGGILLQWGKVSAISSLSSGTVTFSAANIAFPTNCFNVQLTTFLSGSFTIGSGNGIYVRSLSPTTFTWAFSNTSSPGGGATFNFFWVAIGN